jgi:hypothetical protein
MTGGRSPRERVAGSTACHPHPSYRPGEALASAIALIAPQVPRGVNLRKALCVNYLEREQPAVSTLAVSERHMIWRTLRINS